MNYALDKLYLECAELLTVTGLLGSSLPALVQPKPSIPADLAFPAFQAAQEQEADSAVSFAQQLVEAIKLVPGGLVARVTAAGPYVNFQADPARLARAVLDEVTAGGDGYGQDDRGVGQTVVLEFSSPNIARKMHVGHLRSTVIGHSLRLIFQALGYRVIADNHLGDWGTQFGSLLAAKALWGWPPKMETDPIEALVQIYAKFHAAAEADPALRDLARDWFRRLEAGDPDARSTWRILIDLTLTEFARTYARLGITFDTEHGESFYESMLPGVVQEALDKGVAKAEPDGAISVSFDNKLPSFLIRKRDGVTLYQTRDIATCLYRQEKYAPDRNIYVVGQEQKLHFQQVFETVRRMGHAEIADRSVHVSFGMVSDAMGQKFSMRRGTALFLDEVLDEAESRAQATMVEKIGEGRTKLALSEQEDLGQVIGLGAVIYNDLYQSPDRAIRFDWDVMLSFDGNSAPYIQYTYARCRSLLRNAGTTGADAEAGLLTEPQEQAVLKQLARLPSSVRSAGERYLPALIAEWTYELARAFTRFYHDLPVLDAATPGLSAARLRLTAATAQGLRNGLALLGIQAPERM